MKKLVFTASSLVFIATCLNACDSYKEPATEGDWKVFCEAPNSDQRIKAITDEAKRQKAASMCLNAPWQKFVPSKPRTW
jgi:entry exclusion lipoprotein TrbK